MSRRCEIGQWTVAGDGEIVDVHSGEQMASTFGDRKLAEHIIEAVNAYRATAVPATGQARAEKSRHDVYVRVQNILRAGLRTEEITDDVALDWEPLPDGTERLAGVEVLAARGIEVDGLDIVTGRVHGTAPDTGPARRPTDDRPDRRRDRRGHTTTRRPVMSPVRTIG